MMRTTDIRVLNTDFEYEAILDIYESFIWTDRYNECGDFEIYTKLDANILSIIQMGYYLEIPESDRLMVVESVALEHDYEKGNVITIKGRSAESILDRRVVWDPIILENVGFGSLIKTILTSCFINPTDTNRKVNNFIFSEPIPQEIEDIEIESIQLFGENVYEVITNLCKAYRVGYKITLNNQNQLVFSLYSGIDRTYDQNVYPAVVFSPSFDNILNSNYLQSYEIYKTSCLVLGEGDGTDRTKVEVNKTGTFTGLNRREMSISETITTDGTTVTNENYPLQLYQCGSEALTENDVVTSFDGEIDPTLIYIYGQDYNLGDIVQTVNEFGLENKTRVVEYIRSYSNSGINFYPTFDMDSAYPEDTSYNVISYNVYNARQAVEDAERAANAADTAEGYASQAATAAGNAASAASSAQADATLASSMASASANSAANAAISASTAATRADEATASAIAANEAANGTLNSLSTVESVIDTLQWISNHGVYQITNDNEILPGKLYFEVTPTQVSNPDITKIRQYYEQTYQTYIFTGTGEEKTFELSRTESSVTAKVNGSTTSVTLNGKFVTFSSAPADGSSIVITSGTHIVYNITNDEVIADGKTYYTLEAEPFTNTTQEGGAIDPAESGLYELAGVDEAINNYIMSHVALTDDGLYVLSDESAYKVLITNSSVEIVDPRNVSTFKFGAVQVGNDLRTNVQNDYRTAFKLGGENSYIEYYDSDNDTVLDSIKVVGANIFVGDSEDTIEDAIEAEANAREKSIQDIEDAMQEDYDTLAGRIQYNTNYRQDLSGYIAITTTPPSITLGEKTSETKVQITNEKINFISKGSTTATASGQEFYAPQGRFQFFKMKTVEGRGYLRFIARSNGHVTLKVVK